MGLNVDEKLRAEINAAVEIALDKANTDTLPVSIHLIRKLTTGKTGMPCQKTPGSAGWDLRYMPPPGFRSIDARPEKGVSNSAVSINPLGQLTLYHGGSVLLPTGIRIAVPEGFEAQVRPRSGLATKGLMVTNSPGTIDSDYRGEVKVLLTMAQTGPVMIMPGDSIAQLVFVPVYHPEFEECTEAEFDKLATERGTGGFGSTGA